jgi:hypothetical protein
MADPTPTPPQYAIDRLSRHLERWAKNNPDKMSRTNGKLFATPDEIKYYAFPLSGPWGGAAAPATAWFFQRTSRSGDMWMAVVDGNEPESDWFEGEGPWPTPRTYPIDQRPPSGTLIYRRADGSGAEEAAQ